MSRRALAKSGAAEMSCFKDVLLLGAAPLTLTVGELMTG